jgi:hypothetical protein
VVCQSKIDVRIVYDWRISLEDLLSFLSLEACNDAFQDCVFAPSEWFAYAYIAALSPSLFISFMNHFHFLRVFNFQALLQARRFS